MKPSPIPQPRLSPVLTSKQFQRVASTSRKYNLFPLPFQDTQVFQNREHWAIRATREDPNVVNKGKDGVDRLFGKVNRNSREVIIYANDRMIPGTSFEEMASKFSWYGDELKKNFQRTFDYFSKDN
ncbi:hypothetical protein O181_040417 [Austropuccinia psidii MF-1]|uniref:Uncharacterized protein n=1 Tax=Austropuccinia psidii MF-1 TaxID=1389203 RepID=A0A9Q3DIR9_9BASI|nr:hypothetical protein [Austropuccinia psidii MF-1]